MALAVPAGPGVSEELNSKCKCPESRDSHLLINSCYQFLCLVGLSSGEILVAAQDPVGLVSRGAGPWGFCPDTVLTSRSEYVPRGHRDRISVEWTLHDSWVLTLNLFLGKQIPDDLEVKHRLGGKGMASDQG